MGRFDADVIVVGAGPAGLMLAGELRVAGVSVVVVDRLPEPMRQSRALGFSARTIEEFDQRGLLPLFGSVDTIPIGHFGGLLVDYRVVEGGSFGARGIPQSVTERVLGNWVEDLGGRIHRGHEVVGLDSDDDGVAVDVATPEGRKRLRAAYVAGCDGAWSTVRRLAGIDFPGRDGDVEVWLADVTNCRLRPRFVGERVPGGMVMVLPAGPDTSRIILHEHGNRPQGRQQAPSFTEVADAYQRLTGEDIHAAKPLWVSWFTNASRLASRYREGRVFLAGDAAHIHLPIAAQGMSAGVQDAVNLGWKLAAQVRGYAPPGLLGTYHAERHPVGVRLVANTLAQGMLYLGGDEMQPLRDILAELMVYQDVRRHLVGMVSGLDIRYDVGPGEHPLLGGRLPNRELVVAGGKTTSYEFLHAGRGVLLDLADDPELRRIAAGWSDRVDIVTADLRDCEAPLDGLLVRPDGYVAWTTAEGAGGDGLTDALTRWFGEPGKRR